MAGSRSLNPFPASQPNIVRENLSVKVTQPLSCRVSSHTLWKGLEEDGISILQDSHGNPSEQGEAEKQESRVQNIGE